MQRVRFAHTRRDPRARRVSLFRRAEVASVPTEWALVPPGPLTAGGRAPGNLRPSRGERMPTLTIAEIDALLEAEREFPKALQSQTEIDRLLDMRIQAGTEEGA